MKSLSHSFYLIFRERPRGRSSLGVRTTERTPALDVGEVSVYVTVDLPEALFRRTALRARITVPGEAVTPMTVDAAVAENIAETVKRELGLEMRLVVEGAPE